eukprot:753572-Hanusia_phi.AAC.5
MQAAEAEPLRSLRSKDPSPDKTRGEVKQEVKSSRAAEDFSRVYQSSHKRLGSIASSLPAGTGQLGRAIMSKPKEQEHVKNVPPAPSLGSRPPQPRQPLTNALIDKSNVGRTSAAVEVIGGKATYKGGGVYLDPITQEQFHVDEGKKAR